MGSLLFNSPSYDVELKRNTSSKLAKAKHSAEKHRGLEVILSAVHYIFPYTTYPYAK